MPRRSSGVVSLRTRISAAAEVGLLHRLGLLRREHDLTRGRTRSRRNALRQELAPLARLFFCVRVEQRLQQLTQVAGWDELRRNRLVRGDQAFLYHIVSHTHGGEASPLGVARLEHVQLVALNSELDVLHVVVVLFELVSHSHQFLVRLGHVLAEGLFDSFCGPAAVDDVFALGVDQIVAAQARRAERAVARQGHPGRAVVAESAEHHRHDAARRSPIVGNIVLPTVHQCPVAHPRAEHGADGVPDLIERVLGEVLAGVFADGFLVTCDDRFQGVGIQFVIELDTLALLDVREDVVERFVVIGL